MIILLLVTRCQAGTVLDTFDMNHIFYSIPTQREMDHHCPHIQMRKVRLRWFELTRVTRLVNGRSRI